MSKYPAQIDTIVSLPKVADNLSAVTGETVNRLRQAIVAIESELGIKPSGVYATVRARLDALDDAIANLNINDISGDVEGTLNNTKVIGLGGRPLSDAQPSLNQIISWNGIAWVPESIENVTVNILPTTITLPTDIVFLAGDGYANSSTPIRVGAREIDMTLFPTTYPDGRIQTLRFIADIQVTNTATDGYVQLKDVTHNVVIFNSLLKTNSSTIIEYSTIVNAAMATDGYIRTDCCDPTMYEVQAFVTGGNSSDYVIVRNARIQVTYSSPILISALVPLALPVDVNFVCGTELNGFPTPAIMASRNLDMAYFPVSLPDGRLRKTRFYFDAEVSAPGVTGGIQLWDATHNVAVTGTNLTFTNTVTDEIMIDLIVGSSNGNIRSDISTRYEIRAWKVSGSVTDRVIINNARVTITYE